MKSSLVIPNINGGRGGNMLPGTRKKLIFLFILICFTVSFKTIAAEACDDLGQTGAGNQTPPNCFNIQFSPPPPEEVDPEVTQELELNITARIPPPYYWAIDQVDGSGFGLQASVTAGTTNTLYINGDACGTVKIIVYAIYNEEVHECQKEIRAKSGKWVLVESGGCYAAHAYKAIEITGGDKWEEKWCFKYWHVNYPETDCENLGWCGRCGPFPPHTKAPEFIWAPCYSEYVTCKYCWVTSYRHYRWKCP